MNFSDSNPLHREDNNNLGLLPVSSSAGSGPDLDFSFFEDLDFKPKDQLDPLEDLDFIEEKSMLAVAPSMLTLGQPKISEAERRRNDAIALLKSLSVPDPLLGQLVNESMAGFIFVVDAHGTVEFVSDSSAEHVGHPPEQIRGNQIYQFLHPSDHSRFGCHLVQQQSPPTTNTDPDKARRNFTCRFKLNNSDNYITLYVGCITVRRNQESAETSRLLCVARKLSDVSPHPLTIVTNANNVVNNATDLFTTKLDPASFKVMHADTRPGASSTSRLRASVAAKTLSMVGKCFLDFSHPEDRDLVRGHFLSTVRDKQSVSRVYRMTGLIGNNNGSINQRLANVVHVQTKSKYHKVNNTGFIVSIHSIVGDVPHRGTNHPPSILMTTNPTTSTVTYTKSSPKSSSSSPTSENSEEAKNLLLKQLLNSNFQPAESNEEGPLVQLMDSKGLKRHASGPLEDPPSGSKMPSVVCSENPSLTELLEKPPHLSITVPPPVPTKWHQEPREKLPKDIMRKFLPPHPAERAAAAAAAAAAATAKTESSSTNQSSALYNVLTSSRSGIKTSQLVYTSNSSTSAQTFTSASTSSNLNVEEEKDDMLSEILDGLIEFQEKSPMIPSNMPSKAGDERRISDIEKFLVSSERTIFPGNQHAKPKTSATATANSSLAAASPSLTSILAAPPLANTSGRPPPVATNSNGSRSAPVNLVPRMNELLQQVPPNVSIPDTPDLDSLILLQERRRRMSSGGGSTSNNEPQFQPQQPQLQPQAQPQPKLLMQQLTSTAPTRTVTVPQLRPSYLEPQPQVLARRSSFSDSAAAQAAANAAAAAAQASARGPNQRHSSGGTVHHLRVATNAGQPRRLSDSMEPIKSESEKQRSLLQQLLSE